MQLAQDVSNDRFGVNCVEVSGSATRELITERPVFGTVSWFPRLLNHDVICLPEFG
jgi:hypothetical protein